MRIQITRPIVAIIIVLPPSLALHSSPYRSRLDPLAPARTFYSILDRLEREIGGARKRLAVRTERSASLLANLESWMREQRPKLSRGNDIAQAMDYMLKRWPAFARA